jgi:hypothetical protein
LGEAVGRGTRAGETGLSGDEESDDGSERSRGRGLSREGRGSLMEDGSRSRSRSYSRSPSRSRSGSYSRSRSRSFSSPGSRRRTTAVCILAAPIALSISLLELIVPFLPFDPCSATLVLLLLVNAPSPHEVVELVPIHGSHPKKPNDLNTSELHEAV